MYRMPLLVEALDLPALLDHVDLMDERDAEYDKPLGAFFPEAFLKNHGMVEEDSSYDGDSTQQFCDRGEG